MNYLQVNNPLDEMTQSFEAELSSSINQLFTHADESIVETFDEYKFDETNDFEFDDGDSDDHPAESEYGQAGSDYSQEQDWQKKIDYLISSFSYKNRIQ